MGLNHSPSIVTNGLILTLDAGNKKSYLGSGRNWISASSTVTANLSNPTYSSGNGGYITFNGTSDKANITVGAISVANIANNFTVSFWCRPKTTHQIDTQATTGTAGTNGQKYLLDPTYVDTDASAGISLGTNGTSVYEHGAFYMPPILVDTTPISNTNFTNIVIVYSSKQPSLYINGNFIKSGFTSPKSNVYLYISSIGWQYQNYGYFNGDISVINAYNRALTAAEISQNYNALKGRFGL